MALTILKVEKLTRGRVQIRFSSRGGGCPGWQSIVDDTGDLIAVLGEVTEREPAFIDGEKSLGRSARVDLPLQLYVALRVALEQHDTARPALAAQRLMIEDADVVAPLVLTLARAYFPQELRWVNAVREHGVSAL
jgi:hypothetical protein